MGTQDDVGDEAVVQHGLRAPAGRDSDIDAEPDALLLYSRSSHGAGFWLERHALSSAELLRPLLARVNLGRLTGLAVSLVTAGLSRRLRG